MIVPDALTPQQVELLRAEMLQICAARVVMSSA